MNKLFTRIATLSVGLTLAIGMGVAAIVKSSKSTRVDAASQSGTTVTFTASDFSGQGTSSTGSAVSTTAYGITVSSNKAYGTSELRVYQNGSFTISSSVGNITSLSFTFSGGKTGGLQTSYTGLSTASWEQASLASQARFTEIVVTYAGSGPTLSSIEVSTAPTKVAYAEGETFDPTGLVINRIYSSGSPSTYAYAGHESEFTFSPTTSTALTTSDTSVTITYGGKSTSQAITVSSAPSSGDYQKASDISVGDTVLLVYETGKYELNGISTTSTKYGLGVQYSTVPNGAYELTVEEGSVSGSYSFKHVNDYLDLPSDGNVLNKTTTKSNTSSWTVSFSGGNAVITNVNYTSRSIKWNNTSGQYRFASYSSGQQAIQMYKKVSTETTTALSVSPNSWTGYDSETIDLTDFSVSCTTSAQDDGYIFQGIGSGSEGSFVGRDADKTSFVPKTTDTRLQWKAKYPTTLGGSEYLYTYVSLNVSADGVSSLAITGSMTKTTYSQGEAWDPSGFTVNAYYLSAPSTPVNVTNEEGLTWSYNPATTASLSTTSVVCTATYGGQTAVSNSQKVTITEMNPIQDLYTKTSGASVDVYGYYVGFLDGTGPVIMDGEYGIVIYDKTADVSGYTEKETVLHVTGSISIYKGLYEIGSASISVASGSYDEPDAPVVYATKGGETADKASRLTTVTGTPALVSGSFDDAAGTADIKMNFAVGLNSIQVFYKKAAQTADADAFAAIKAAVAGSDEITIKGFTGWYDDFQVQMNGYVPPAEGYTAEDFAQDLLDQTDAICEDYDGVTNNKTALEAVWSNLASNDKYPSLPSAEKTILAEAERDESGTVVEQAMARYDYLTGKYSLNNFINGRTPVVFSNSNILFKTSNNTMLIVVVASIATVSSIGLCILIIKKRKHQ